MKRLTDNTRRAEQLRNFGYGPAWQKANDSLLDKLMRARIWLKQNMKRV